MNARATCTIGDMTDEQPQWPDRAWLTAQELAGVAKVHYDTIRREIKRRQLAAELNGRNYVIDRAEAERWLGQFQKYAGLKGPRERAEQT